MTENRWPRVDRDSSLDGCLDECARYCEAVNVAGPVAGERVDDFMTRLAVAVVRHAQEMTP